MSKYTFTLLATLAAFALQPQPGDGLRCYMCSSDSDPRCGDPFDQIDERDRPYVRPFEAVECDNNRSPTPYLSKAEPSCKKVVQTVSGRTVVERSCAWFSPEDDPCPRKHMKYNHKVEHCSLCHEDICNSASTGYLATFALTASILVAKSLS